MQVNAQLIRLEREQRGWSQSHLASVCGLGLRTVQRIEAHGSASYESATAIAAAFSMPVAALKPPDHESGSKHGGQPPFRRAGWLPEARTVVRLAAGMLAAILVVSGGFYYQAASAAPIKVEFGVVRNGDEPFMGGVLPGARGGFGREDLVVRIRSVVQGDGSIVLRARIYECEGDREEDDLRLLSESEVTTMPGSMAEIRFRSVLSGDEYAIQLTPRPG